MNPKESEIFSIDAEEIALNIRKAASEANNEADLRQEVEYILRSLVIEKLKMPLSSWKPPKAKYEVTLFSGIRPDVLYGHVIIEYEAPKKFEAKVGFEHAIEQVKMYIRDHARNENAFNRYFGVVLDGYKIGFVRYRGSLGNFESKGPFEVSKNTIAKFVEALIGLNRKALNVDDLLRDFGPDSIRAREIIRLFHCKLKGATPRTMTLFEDWKRVFSQVCRYDLSKLRGLETAYGFSDKEIDVEKLLFALDTYFALIMKLLAAEVASLYVAPRLWSFLRSLEDAYFKGHDRLKEELGELEEGGIFAKLGISNFLEADYFAWYIDEWDETLAEKVAALVEKLSDYDPSAAELEPERVKDLLKRLYQNLVPKEIRHGLGEYYTPDWLADLVLDECGWTIKGFEKISHNAGGSLKPLESRLLDPACGSGTFIVLAISRLKQYAEEHWLDRGTVLNCITRNIIGFDLNPLAVIASRANYLIALGDLLREKGAERIEIPIFLADSIMIEQRLTAFGTNAYVLKTVAGEFVVPVSIVKNRSLSLILSIIKDCVKGNYTNGEFRSRLAKEVNLNELDVSLLIGLFETMVRLEREGKNGLWVRILKNSFAPLLMGKFDFVVGNPPWINWESLPDSYRQDTKSLWGWYQLLERTKGLGLGKFKRDMAMLFVARCMDRYTNNGGRFAFLIPLTVFKSQSGAGFRKFLSRDILKTENIKCPCKVLKIHDLVTLYPFEGATNRTSLIVIEKKHKTIFPIPCTLWSNQKSISIEQGAELKEVKKNTEQFDLFFIPMDRNKPETPWMETSEKAYEGIRNALGSSPQYRAYAGMYTGLNQAYWVKKVSEGPDGILVTNPLLVGQKKQVKQVEEVIEEDLIFTLIRGRDVKKWYVLSENRYVIIPHDNKSGKPLSESVMKVDYPKSYKYFNKLRGELENRAIQKLWGKGKPFYSVYDIGNYTFYPYKVVWKEIAGKIAGKGEFSVAVVEPEASEKGKNLIAVPDHKLMFIPLKNRVEAYYVAGILNSTIAKFIVASYTIETTMDTHISNSINIPRFDSKNPLHSNLANLSMQAHREAKHSRDAKKETIHDLKDVEKEIDDVVAAIYGIDSNTELEIRKCLNILSP
jgi:hypothetical protein